MESLKQVSYSSTLMRNSAQTLAVQISLDTRIDSLFTYNPPVLDERYALDQLNAYRNTSPFMDSIYIYNGSTDKFYVNSSINEYIYTRNNFIDRDILDILNSAGSYESPYMTARSSKIILPGQINEITLNTYTYILFDYTDSRNTLDSAVLLNISEEWMRKTIDALDSSPGSDTFIIDNRGIVVVRSKKYGMMQDISGMDYIAEIMNSKKSSGYFVREIDGVKSLVTYLDSGLFGWKFIRITPYSSILHQINDMKAKTLLICFIILTAGLILTYLLSKKLYKPIDNIINNLRKLEDEKKGNFFSFKQKFLQSLLNKEIKYTDELLRKNFGDYRIDLEPRSSFRILLLKIDGFADFCTKYKFEDRSLIRVGMMNIARELCSAHYANEAIDAGDDHIVLLFGIPSGEPEQQRTAIDDMIRAVQDALLRRLNISVSAAVSSVGYTTESLGDLYEEAVDASLYRIFKGNRSIIYSEDTEMLKFTEYAYPAEREKYMLEMLRQCKAEEAIKACCEIIRGTEGYSYGVLRSTVSHLEFTINHTIGSIEKSIGFSFFYNAYIDPGRYEFIYEIEQRFSEMLMNFFNVYEERKNSRSDELLEKITSIINEKYMEYDLSVDTIAKMSGISPSYLGRFFKKLTSKSIVDYINEIRINKAKELLISSDWPVTKISEQTGFTNSSYFYTVFRKTTGVTPNEFRRSNNSA